jgi:hypothetical protein
MALLTVTQIISRAPFSTAAANARLKSALVG